MGNLWSNLFIFIILSSHLFSQFGSVEISFDDRLLRNDEKQVLLPLKEDIQRFFLTTSWDKEYIDLDIPLYIQLIFEGSSSRGNVTTFLCQALFSNGSDLRYFDKGVQFYYSAGTNLYFDLVLFEPLSGFLSYYAQLILAGEIDTYEFRGGNTAFEIAREIALRGSGSEYKKGWASRTALVDDLSGNSGLRKARLAYYVAIDLMKEGDVEGAIKEFENMLDGLEQTYLDFGREQQAQYFMKIQSENLVQVFSSIGQRKLLQDIKELDPDRWELYQTALDSMSE